MNSSGNSQPASKVAPAVKEIGGWRGWLLWPVHLLLRLWWRSLRFNIDAESRRILEDQSQPRLFILWHNRIFVAAELRHRFRKRFPMTAMISASGDGAWLAALYRLNGIRAARGSSSRRSLSAVRELIACFQRGEDLCITPDGPRGPIYSMQPGAALLARKAACPVVLLLLNFTRARRLRSWDQFAIPCPFSVVRLKVVQISPADIQKIPSDNLSAFLREQLLHHTDEAKEIM